MKPAAFAYHRPDSLQAALDLLQQHGDEAKLLAGGQSLIPAMNFRLVQPAALIDLNRLTELDYVRETPEGGLRIGAMTRQRSLERDPLVRQRAPLIHEMMPYVAHPQIRNRGTLGGSLAHADPAAELPVAMVALGARFRARGPAGERWVPAEEFFRGMFFTALETGEILLEVELPPRPQRTGWAFLEVSRRRGDYAMAGVAVELRLAPDARCETVRLVFLNAGEQPLVASQAAASLQGRAVEPGAIEAAGRIAAAEVQPVGNIHASPEYQRHLVRVLTVRSLAKALERARNSRAEASH
jgi:carbon-monoxide dehydrogenase medium subunit